MQLTLSYPYRFGILLDILARYPQPSLFRLTDGVLWHTLRTGEQIHLLRITGSDNDTTLTVDVVAQSDTSAEHDLTEYIVQLFGLNIDLSAFYHMAQTHADDTLWHIIEPLYGLPIMRTESVYQALLFVIIEQHIAWKSAQQAQYTLVQWANQRIVHDGMTHYATPTAHQLADASVDELQNIKITFKRKQWLIDISQQVITGALDLETPRTPDALYAYLLNIKGVGHWTASVVVSRALGVYPYVAHNDVALQAAVNRYFYGGEGRIAGQLVTETCERYGEYAGLVAHFTLTRWVLDNYDTRPS